MTLGMTSLVFQCFFTFALVSASRWLAEIWELSWRRATGELEVEFKFQRRSSKVSLPFPAPPPERPKELDRRLLLTRRTEISACKPNVNLFAFWDHPSLNSPLASHWNRALAQLWKDLLLSYNLYSASVFQPPTSPWKFGILPTSVCSGL